jgi:hypothetical protein
MSRGVINFRRITTLPSHIFLEDIIKGLNVLFSLDGDKND